MSGWTAETLKEHYDALRIADQRALDAALSSLNERLVFLNELRSIVSDQAATFVTRNEMEVARRYNETTDNHKSVSGRSFIIATSGAMIGLVGVVVGIVGQLTI